MPNRIGFVGAGRMGSILLKGFLSERVVDVEDLTAYDIESDKLKEIARQTGLTESDSLKQLLEASDIIFLCVKPVEMERVLGLVGPHAKDILIVSVAAGVSTSFIEARCPDSRVIRVMPNHCGLVSEMASAYCVGQSANKEDMAAIEALLESVGKVYRVEETHMDVVTGLSGSGPAYIYLVIEALAAAAEKQGLSKSVAFGLAVQTVKGAAEMADSSQQKTGELIDSVCSPGGTTIEGMKILKQYQVSEAFMEAVDAATKKSRELLV
ncbi:MAG: pyrroline-5-carboxylate reductase [Candidatus Altiarchaeales archaeon]|nr:pyrroline-5-carboxylate reductase [Candidatus Altiarchaeales archaeon]